MKDFWFGVTYGITITLLAFWLSGCQYQVKNAYKPGFLPDPKAPYQMRTYTVDGYAINWWIFEEKEGACTIEYSVYFKSGNEYLPTNLTHGVIPCEMMAVFFHSIQPRNQAHDVPKAPNVQRHPNPNHD